MEIPQLLASAPYRASDTANVNAPRSSGKSQSSSTSSSGLDMTDFLKLLAAQFENQDIMNPTDNTEYISELAQFSSIEAMNTLTVYADHQYAASLVGKTVQVKGTDASGKTVFDAGKVSYADFSSSDGSSAIVVNGHAYDVSSVMQILSDSVSGTGGGDPGATGKNDGGTDSTAG